MGQRDTDPATIVVSAVTGMLIALAACAWGLGEWRGEDDKFFAADKPSLFSKYVILDAVIHDINRGNARALSIYDAIREARRNALEVREEDMS